MESASRFDFTTFSQYLANKGLTDAERAELPIAADGTLLWDCMRSFFDEFLGAHYADDGMLEKDEEAQAFWTYATGKELLPTASLPPPGNLCRTSLSLYLTRAVFFSTAMHELL